MSKQLSVVNIEYAGGKSAKGTKVKLSDGSYLADVSFVETTVGVDQVAEVLIRLIPDFENPNETTNTQTEIASTENSTKD